MGISLWILLLGIIFVGILTYYITMSMLLTQLKTAQNVPHLIQDINSILLKSIGLVFVSLIVFAGALEIVYLHRVAGPMYRIARILDELSQGKRITQVKLRKKDFFKNIADSINKLIQFQNERDEKFLAILKEVKKLPELKEKVAELEPFFPDFSKES